MQSSAGVTTAPGLQRAMGFRPGGERGHRAPRPGAQKTGSIVCPAREPGAHPSHDAFVRCRELWLFGIRTFLHETLAVAALSASLSGDVHPAARSFIPANGDSR